VITGKLLRQLALRRNRTGKHAQYPRDGSLGDPARRPVAAFEGMDAVTTAENDAQNSRFGTAGEAFQLPAKSHLTSPWARPGRQRSVTERDGRQTPPGVEVHSPCRIGAAVAHRARDGTREQKGSSVSVF